MYFGKVPCDAMQRVWWEKQKYDSYDHYLTIPRIRFSRMLFVCRSCLFSLLSEDSLQSSSFSSLVNPGVFFPIALCMSRIFFVSLDHD